MAKTMRDKLENKPRQRGQKPPATAPAAEAGRTKPRAGKDLKVRVQRGRLGQYPASGPRRREGDVFRLLKESDFSSKWMEWAGADDPEHTTTPAAAMRKQTAGIRTKQLQPNAADLVDDDEEAQRPRGGTRVL